MFFFLFCFFVVPEELPGNCKCVIGLVRHFPSMFSGFIFVRLEP